MRICEAVCISYFLKNLSSFLRGMLNKKKISLRVMAALVLGKSKDLMEKFPFSMVTESHFKYIVTVWELQAASCCRWGEPS